MVEQESIMMMDKNKKQSIVDDNERWIKMINNIHHSMSKQSINDEANKDETITHSSFQSFNKKAEQQQQQQQSLMIKNQSYETEQASVLTRTKTERRSNNYDDDDNQNNNEFFSFPCNPYQLRNQKDHFFLYARILLKYLEHRDKGANFMARNALREMLVVDNNNNNDNNNYKIRQRRQRQRPAGNNNKKDNIDDKEVNRLLEMYQRLKNSVSQFHWDNALQYYHLFLQRKRQQQQQQQQRLAGLNLGNGTNNPTVIPPTDDE